MKYLRIAVLISLLVFLGSFPCLAESTATSKEFGVTAFVEQQLELTGWMSKSDAGNTQSLARTESAVEAQGQAEFPSTMDFGTFKSELLSGDDAGCLYSPEGYTVFLVAKTSGRPYKIQSVATAIDGKDEAFGYKLPDEAFVLTPSYHEEDELSGPTGKVAQGADPNPGSKVGSQVCCVGTHEIYDSGSGGVSRVVRANYSFFPYLDAGDQQDIQARPSGWSPVPKDQHYGPYEGTVTISVVLK